MQAFFDNLWLYQLLLFGIIILPGVDMAFVLASTLAGGLRQGFAALAGIVAGGVAHTVIAMLGLGLLVALYPLAFNMLLLAGAAYIGWIGLQLFRGASALTRIESVKPATAPVTFWRGMATCLLNPKAYTFMLAVFPQFVRPEFGPLMPQALIASLLGAANQIAVYGAVALGAGKLRGWLIKNPSQQVLLGRVVGLMLIATAIWAAWSGFKTI